MNTTGDGEAKSGEDNVQEEASCPPEQFERAIYLPGASGGTGVRTAKEALRALSMDKSCPETREVA